MQHDAKKRRNVKGNYKLLRIRERHRNDCLMEFIKSIKAEGVELERTEMDDTTAPIAPLNIEIDDDNPKKDLNALDITIPLTSSRFDRNFDCLDQLDISAMNYTKQRYHLYSDEEQREIVFKDITTDEVDHSTILKDPNITDYHDILWFFAEVIMKSFRLFSGYHVIYPQLKNFIESKLFDCIVELDSPNTLRNLSEVAVTKTLIETFKKAINELIVRDKGRIDITGQIRLQDMRPFVVKEQDYMMPKKSVYKRMVWDSELEREFIEFLEYCPDVVSFAKNYEAVGFKLDYVKSDGGLSYYFPDFFVRVKFHGKNQIVIVETKGRIDIAVPLKMVRLKQWCEEVNRLQDTTVYSFLYVDQAGFETYRLETFAEMLSGFSDFQ